MPRYRWTILAVGTGAQTAFSAVLLGLPVLAPELRDHFGLSLRQVALLLAAQIAGSTATTVPWGLLADRLGERRVIAVGLGTSSLALVLAAAAGSFGVLLAALAVAGALGAAVQSASGRAVMGWFDPAERGLALGVRQTAIPAGGFLAAVVLPPVVSAGGLAAAFLAFAGAAALGALASALWLRDPPAESGPPPAGRSALRDRRIWRLAVGSSFLLFAQTGLIGFLVLYLHDERGLSPGLAAASFAGVNVVGGALRIGLGAWSDRLARRIAPLRRVGVALAGALALAVLATGARNALLLPPLLVAATLSISWNGLSYAATAELAGRGRSGGALGLQQSILGAVAVLGPLAFAAAVSAASWRAGFALLALAPLGGWLLLAPLAAAEERASREPSPALAAGPEPELPL
ncbi:MAG: MFS transporter [Actinobacteria bacterium]|nr:MFS transporter [Actinomycetota bacterium]